MGIIRDTLEPPLDWCARQIYWRSKTLRNIRAYINKHRKKKPITAFISETELRDILTEIGVGTKSPVTLVHSSVNNWAIKNPDNTEPFDSFETAMATLNILLELTEKNNATLAMPTHPYYKETAKDPFVSTIGLKLKYDPEITPSKVGLITELFRRHPNVKRSLFPLSSVASIGPLTDELLQNNLNGEKPTPHGKNSPYYRIFKSNGLIVSIGMPLIECLTIIHVPLEMNENLQPDWIYRKRIFDIIMPDGMSKEWNIWELHPATCRCWGEKMCGRDLRNTGILHENIFAGVRIDWAFANEVYTFIIEKRKKSEYYPYPFLTLSRPLSQ
jgi:aminoglycoside 3-N-acetyltransferase